MQTNRLQYFLAVATCGSFTEAAEALFTTQSAVSKQVLALERELQCRLFDRSKRGVALTEQGKTLLPYAQRIAGDCDEVARALSALRQDQQRQLSIATIPVMAQYRVTATIAAFRRAHPDVELLVDELEAEDILAAMERNRYELAIMRQEIMNPALYEGVPLCADRMVAVLPVNHPLATLSVVSLMQFRDENVLLLNHGTLLYDYHLAAFRREGFQPNVCYNGARAETIAELVAQSMGVSLMMEKIIAYHASDAIRVVPLLERIESVVALIRAQGSRLSPSASAFWEFARRTAADGVRKT